MKRCPICERSYGDAVEVCEVDGAILREAGAKQDILIGRVLKGRYRVMQELGEGGMGTVYLAEQVTIGRKIALKVLHEKYVWDEEFVKRFRQEARLTAALNHPHVITIYDFDQVEDGSLFIAMEYVEGKNLKEVIQEGPLDILRAVGLGIQMAEGLGAAHRVGVIHRDVKPENIMLATATDQLKLTDFGIARLRDADAPARLTRSGTIMGTPAYMAPEQIEGAEVSERTDIYAFGIVLYEMLAGEVPFKAPTPGAILVKHLKDAPLPLGKLRRVPASVEQVVMQALEKRPEKRAQSMEEIINSLRAAVESGIRTRATRSEALLADFAERQEQGQRTVIEKEEEEWPRTLAVSPTLRVGRMAKLLEGKRKLIAIGALLVILAVAGLIAVTVYAPKDDAQKPEESPLPVAEIVSITVEADRSHLSPKERAFLKLKAHYSDGREEEAAHGVEWESNDPSVVSVNVTGELEALREGTAEVTARYEGRRAEPIRVTVKGEEPKLAARPVFLESLTIYAGKQELRAKERMFVGVRGKYSDGKVVKIGKVIEWKSSDEGIASVTPEGEVVGNKKGEVQITARHAGILSSPLTLSVLPEIAHVVSLMVRASRREILVGETVRLRAEAKYSDGEVRDLSETVIWQSSDASVAEISPPGMVVGRTAGKVTVTGAYQGLSSQVAVVVKDKQPEQVPKPPVGKTPQEQLVAPGRYKVIRSTPVVKEPHKDASVVARVEEGTIVNVVGVSGDYLRVESKRGNPPGYVRREDVSYPVGQEPPRASAPSVDPPKGHPILAWANGRSIPEAENLAISNCSRKGASNCKIVVSVCTTQGRSPSYGAIAYSRLTRQSGYSHDYATTGEARARALSECRGPDCGVLITFRNGCAALAKDERD